MFPGSGAPMLEDFPDPSQPSSSNAIPGGHLRGGGNMAAGAMAMDPRLMPTPLLQTPAPQQQQQQHQQNLAMPLLQNHSAGVPSSAGLPGSSFPSVVPVAPPPQPGGAVQSGMINLSDLQPTISANSMNNPHSILALSQGIDSLPATLQHDQAFVQAVQAQQVGQAAVAALRAVKLLIAKEGLPGLLGNVAQGLRHSDGDALFVNQRVVVQDNRKRHDAVVLHPGDPDGLVVVKLQQTGVQERVLRRNVLPAPHNDTGVLGHDLIDPDFLGDVDDILGGGFDILDTAVMGGTPQQSSQPPGGGLGSMHGVLDPQYAGLHIPGAVGQQQRQQLARKTAPPPPGISAEAKAALVARVRKDVLQLEERVPWVLARLSWQKERQHWREELGGCQAAESLVPLLSVFCGALHRAPKAAGGSKGGAPGAGGPRAAAGGGGMRLLVDALGTEVAAGREVHRMLDARWDEARSDVESWLEAQGLARLLPLCSLVGKAAVALEQAAAKGGEYALLQVPLEAMLGNNAAAMALLKDVVERERGSLLLLPSAAATTSSGAQEPTGSAAPAVTFAEVLGPGGILGKRRHPEAASGSDPGMEAEDYGDTTDVDDMDITGPS